MDPWKAGGAAGLLARWAWECDMDEMEREALARAPQDPHYLRLAWQPVALWGPDLARAGLRKVRRAAMGRLDARDLSGDGGWEALGQGAEDAAGLRRSVAALDALCEPARMAELWGWAREAWENGAAKPFAPIARVSSLAGLEWGSRAWRAASWSAIATMDWDDEMDEARAQAAWSAIERVAIDGGVEGADESGTESGRGKRL